MRKKQKVNKKNLVNEFFDMIQFIFKEIKKIPLYCIKGNSNNFFRKFWVKYHPIFWRKIHSTNKIKKKLIPYFQNKRGIRIGGRLGEFFKNLFVNAREIIDVNIIQDYHGIPIKVDYLTDATNLYFAKNNFFDYICNSHVLEHLSNPIKAFLEWIRVLKVGGIIYCAVPDKRFTFDHNRKRTSLKHLIDDYSREINGPDIIHVKELTAKWDEDMDEISNREQFLNNIRKNPLIHTHCHVWIKRDIINLFKYVGLKLIFVVLIGNTIHIFGKKSD